MKTRVFWSSLATIVALSVAACAPPLAAPQGGEPHTTSPTMPQRTLVIAARGEPPTLAAKPLLPFSGSLAPPVSIFNATLDYADEDGLSHALLAEALPQAGTDTWRVFPDGRMETTYRLKPDLTWQDGTPVSADDFVFAWRVYSSPELGTAKSPPIVLMETVAAPDPRTVVIRWGRLYGNAGELGSDFQALPRHLLQAQFGESDPQAFAGLPFWSQDYVGLGPYRVSAWEPGAYIEGIAFDGYVLGRPKIDRLKVQFISDPNTALANLLAGEVQFVGDFILGAAEGATIEAQWSATQGGTVLYAPTEFRSTVLQLRPEYAEPPALLDPRVRHAVAYGIDSAALVQAISGGKGVLTYTLTSPLESYYPEVERVITKRPYDPRQAAQLMEEAGYRTGADGWYVDRSGQSIDWGVWSSSGTKNEQQAAITVDTLERAGFDASAHVVPAAQLRDAKARALIPGLSLRGQGMKRIETYTSEQIPGPDNRWVGENRGGWANSDYDRLFAAFNNTLDREGRIAHIVQMEKVFSADMPTVPNYFDVAVDAYFAALQGPVTRKTPYAGPQYFNISRWEWRQ